MNKEMPFVLKLPRAVFGFLIVTLNSALVLIQSVLSIIYPMSPLVTPILIFIDAVGNAGIVLLTTEQQAAPGP